MEAAAVVSYEIVPVRRETPAKVAEGMKILTQLQSLEMAAVVYVENIAGPTWYWCDAANGASKGVSYIQTKSKTVSQLVANPPEWICLLHEQVRSHATRIMTT